MARCMRKASMVRESLKAIHVLRVGFNVEGVDSIVTEMAERL